MKGNIRILATFVLAMALLLASTGAVLGASAEELRPEITVTATPWGICARGSLPEGTALADYEAVTILVYTVSRELIAAGDFAIKSNPVQTAISFRWASYPTVLVEAYCQRKCIFSAEVYPAPPEKPILHLIRQGETLRTITKFYHVTIEDVLQVNRIQDPDKIRAGDLLIIPPRGAMPERGWSSEMIVAAVFANDFPNYEYYYLNGKRVDYVYLTLRQDRQVFLQVYDPVTRQWADTLVRNWLPYNSYILYEPVYDEKGILHLEMTAAWFVFSSMPCD